MTRKSEQSYICRGRKGCSKATVCDKQWLCFHYLFRPRTYLSPKFHPKVLRIWQAARGLLLISNLLLLVACSPSNHTEVFAPFELSSFLKNHIQELPGRMVQFQILDPSGEPMPYAILRFEWIEGGHMDFQTNQDGTLSMQFEKDMLENEVMVSTKSEVSKIKIVW